MRSRDKTDGVMFINVFAAYQVHSISKTGMSFQPKQFSHNLEFMFIIPFVYEYMTKGTNRQILGLRNKLGAVWPHLFIPKLDELRFKANTMLII